MAIGDSAIEADFDRHSNQTNPSAAISEEAIESEIRIVQSVQAQNNLPAIMGGLLISVIIVLYLDWQAAISSHAIYFLGLTILMLIPMLQSYLRIRNKPRPKFVSKRRIRLLEIYTFIFSFVWFLIIILVMRELAPIDNAIIIAMTFSICAGGVALNPGLPKAAAGFLVIALLALFIGTYVNNVVSPDLLAFIVITFSIVMARTIWINWRDLRTSVRIGLERLEAEADAHRRETEAMRSMIEAIPFPLVLTRATGALEASETAARQFGIPTGSLGDLSIRDFFANPDDQERMAELQEQQGRLEEYEVRFQDANGRPFWALLSSLPLKYEGEDSWLNAIYVIDDRKRAEEELLAAKQKAEETSKTLEAVSSQLTKYISPQLYHSILHGETEVRIDSRRKKLTIFFSDIVNFTGITDRLESEELTGLLNEYLTEMSKIAQTYGAYFDKFIGDAMMFYFGDPDTKGVKEDAQACVQMAIAMQRRLEQLQIGWQKQGLIDRPFQARMGINTGYCTVGNFGSEDRMDYTIIGGEVNLAARLESHSDAGGILIAAETYSLVANDVMTEEGGAIQMKGFPEPIRTYRIIDINSTQPFEADTQTPKPSKVDISLDLEKASDEDKQDAIQKLEAALSTLKS